MRFISNCCIKGRKKKAYAVGQSVTFNLCSLDALLKALLVGSNSRMRLEKGQWTCMPAKIFRGRCSTLWQDHEHSCDHFLKTFLVWFWIFLNMLQYLICCNSSHLCLLHTLHVEWMMFERNPKDLSFNGLDIMTTYSKHGIALHFNRGHMIQN